MRIARAPRRKKRPCPSHPRAFEDAFFVLYASGAAWQLAAWTRVLGRAPEPGELEPYTVALAGRGRKFSSADYLIAVQEVQAQARKIAGFHHTHGLFMTPTLASGPVPLGHFTALDDDPIQSLYIDAAYAPFTWIANATGQPAMSVPLHWTAN